MQDYRVEDDAPQVAPTIQAPDSLAKGAIITNVLVTATLITGMILDKNSVTLSVLSGVVFFALFGSLVILTLSGSLTHIVTNGQRQKTIRQLYSLQFEAQTMQSRVEVAQPMQIEYRQDVAPLRLPEGTSFVAAVDDAVEGARREAAAWVLSLYGADGEPNPSKVNLSDKKEKPGRVWAKSPSDAALKILTDRGVAHNMGNGIRLAITRCPTAQAALERLRA